MPTVSLARPSHWRCRPLWRAPLWLSLGLLLFAGGCHSSAPVIDVGAKPPDAKGTIYGVVRGPGVTAGLPGRSIDVINTETNKRQTVQTGQGGAFTLELPAGKYRLELALHDGETLTKRPDIVELGHGKIESHIEFVLSGGGDPVHVARPHGPAYRLDNGLGSPIT
jgi:hypothetical protein